MLRLITAGLFLVFLSNTYGEKVPLKNLEHKYKLSVSNLLLPSANSTQGVGQFCAQAHRLSAWPLERMYQSLRDRNLEPLGKALGCAYGVFNAFFLTPQFGLAFHEFGHARSLLAFNPDSDPYYYNDFHLRGYIGDTFYHMLVCAYTNTSRAAMVLPKNVREFIKYAEQHTDKEEVLRKGQALINSPEIDSVVTFGGGLNNQAILAGIIEDQAIFDRGAYVFDFIPIYINKIYPYLYPTIEAPETLTLDDIYIGDNVFLIKAVNDQGTIQRHYKRHKIIPDYDIGMAHFGCFLSLALSSSTYQSIYGMYQFLGNGEIFTKPFCFKGFYLPNTSFFYTSKGLSLRFKIAYEYSPALLFFATYETVYKGLSAHEFVLSAHKTFHDFFDIKLKTSLCASFCEGSFEGMQGSIGISYPVNKYFNIDGSYSLFNGNTLDGERTIPYDDLDHVFSVGITLSF